MVLTGLIGEGCIGSDGGCGECIQVLTGEEWE